MTTEMHLINKKNQIISVFFVEIENETFDNFFFIKVNENILKMCF